MHRQTKTEKCFHNHYLLRWNFEYIRISFQCYFFVCCTIVLPHVSSAPKTFPTAPDNKQQKKTPKKKEEKIQQKAISIFLFIVDDKKAYKMS